jgi:hypothetical protein
MLERMVGGLMLAIQGKWTCGPHDIVCIHEVEGRLILVNLTCDGVACTVQFKAWQTSMIRNPGETRVVGPLKRSR